MDLISRWGIPLGKNILLSSSWKNDLIPMEQPSVHIINLIYIILFS